MEMDNIIKGCLRGDRICQKALYDLLSGKMMAVCMRYSKHRMEAEDLLQDGFIKVFLNLDQYKFEGPFEQWVRRIMINNAIKKYHKKSNQFENTGLDSMVEQGDTTNAVNDLEYGELVTMVNSLPDGYRLVFNLYAIEGYNHGEISTLLNIEESTSRSQLVKARKSLQEKLLKSQKTKV
ncbi:MAG: sigma-70 family RNA polymerase sigma factor [Saprospiraceae bacterium]|nr:sigma-70 family RNA polymerase sigma factor [Candidatus Defluviibacterium haderslevense]MBK7242943.1 sigma-70 family RNA polymerase sigma factor [Candidatus Defluviibacterium haderslevense]